MSKSESYNFIKINKIITLDGAVYDTKGEHPNLKITLKMVKERQFSECMSTYIDIHFVEKFELETYYIRDGYDKEHLIRRYKSVGIE